MARRAGLLAATVAAWFASSPAIAVVVTNVTTNTVIFNSSGFEHDLPEHKPLAALKRAAIPRLWKTAEAPWDVVVSRMNRHIHAKPGSSPDGLHYLKTMRDAAKAGHPVAMFSTNQERPGDLIRVEFSLQLPPDVDAKINLGHEGAGAYRGVLRVAEGQVQFRDGGTWQDVRPALAFAPEKWQNWTIEYEVGAATFSVRLDDGPASAADALESIDAKGAGGLSSVSFSHNREQAFNLDASAAAREAAAKCRTEVQASQDLPQMLQINWRLGPDLPQGIQTPGIGVVDETLVWVGGFCSGGTLYPDNKVPGKPAERYTRGFFDKTWGLDLKNPAAAWQPLPPLPAAGRQSVISGVVNDALYIWGGFSYNDEFTYRDGYRLSRVGEAWQWEKMPDLPWKLCFAGSAAAGDHIFVMGGADVLREPGKPGAWLTAADRAGGVERLGARLLGFNTKSPEGGWQELPACPGTPRFMPAVTAIGNYLYVFGGITGKDNPLNQVATVVDNWRYHIPTREWERLQDLPVATSRHPTGHIVYDDRYVLLITGSPTKLVMNPDGTWRPGYGLPYRSTWGKTTFSDITVYDLESQTFGRANPLPITNNMPTAVVHGRSLYLIGGETESAMFNGMHYGHHPDLLLIGDIQVVGH